MEYLSITSAGEIDHHALSLHGASTKREDDSNIGKFGSGNKYALATLLRNGIEIRIFSGLREIPITTSRETFRGKSFDIIHINGEKTSITTDTGPDWEVRDAVREFWSNAIDEGSPERSVVKEFSPVAGRTSIYIQTTPEIQSMLDSWELYFIDKSTELFSNSHGSIHKTQIPNYYRKGVWICEDRGSLGIFSYNFNFFDLPESRKVSSFSTSYSIYNLFVNCTNQEIAETFLCHIKTATAEIRSFLHYGMDKDFAKTLTHVLKKREFNYIGDRGRCIEESPDNNIFWLPPTAYEVFNNAEILPSIHKACGVDDLYTKLPWPIGMQKIVENAVLRLKAVGIDLTPYETSFCKFNSTLPNTVAMADTQRKLCLIGEAALSASRTMLTKALIEEWTHLHHNVLDRTVEQQHVYLNLIVSLIEQKEKQA